MSSTTSLLPPSGKAQGYGATDETAGRRAPPHDEEALVPADDSPRQFAQFKDIWQLLTGLYTSVFCAALAASIVANIQLDISSSYGAANLSSWLGGAYLLGVAALTPLWGRMSLIFGSRACIIAAVLLFSLGTLGCAFAPTMMSLLAARFVAGMGGSGLLTLTAIIVSNLVSLQDRGLYQGYVNLLFGLGSASGAVVGGFVADRFGWRVAFGMQLVPLAMSFSLILWKVHLPVTESKQSTLELLKRIDWLGSASIFIAVTSLMISLSLHTASGLPYSHPAVISLFSTAAVSAIAFYFIEEAATEPLIPMSLLKMRTPALVLSAFILLTMTTFSRIFSLPVFLHIVRGFNGSQTGLMLLPSSVTGSAGSLFAGWYMRRTGRYKGLTIWSSLLPLLSSLSVVLTWSDRSNKHRLWVEMSLAAFGGGMVITTFLTAIIAAVPKEQMALAISASYMARSLGQVLGASVTGALQQGTLSASLHRLLPDAPPRLLVRIIREPSSTIPSLPIALKDAAVQAYLESIQAVFVFAVVGGAAMLVCACAIRAYSLPGR